MGRPSKFNPKFCEEVTKLCLLGATDPQLADFFETSEATINNWKIAHPEFFEALKDGRDRADSAVVKSLYQRALGYSHKAVKIFLHEGNPVYAEYIERFPPETTACIFWLKNRQRLRWRNLEVAPADENADNAVKITGGLPK